MWLSGRSRYLKYDKYDFYPTFESLQPHETFFFFFFFFFGECYIKHNYLMTRFLLLWVSEYSTKKQSGTEKKPIEFFEMEVFKMPALNYIRISGVHSSQTYHQKGKKLHAHIKFERAVKKRFFSLQKSVLPWLINLSC